MFEPKLRPFKPFQTYLSWEQYENIMEDRERMQPVMQQFIDRALEQTRDCPCKWEFNTSGTESVRYEITEFSSACPWHIAHAQ